MNANRWRPYGWATGIIALLIIGLRSVPAIDNGGAAPVLLLAVLFVARTWGTGPALLASVSAAVGYSYFFLPPFRLGLDDPNDWAALTALATFTISAIVVGELAGRAERRHLEAQAGRREIERLYRELQAAFDRASEAEAARRNEQLKAALLDALTHNLRTPLTAIKASVTALLEARHWQEAQRLSSEGHDELLHVIDEESDRLNRFIEGLSAAGQPEASQPLSFRSVQLDDIMRAGLARGKDRVSRLRALAKAALIRSCLKKQPRGVFTVSGDLSHYDDGRRDLRLSIEEHFLEQVEAFNRVVFDNGRRHTAKRADVFSLKPKDVDLVYLDPPYVPRSDDNCYIKRYHFLEGLSCYWKGQRIMEETRVKKIEKPYTPFSYRKSAIEAFDKLFQIYRESIIVLSYSSNGFPDREELESLLRRYKGSVTAFEKPHRYHFGTHGSVERAEVSEYLIVGR